jgi:hypothetical protein
MSLADFHITYLKNNLLHQGKPVGITFRQTFIKESKFPKNLSHLTPKSSHPCKTNILEKLSNSKPMVTTATKLVAFLWQVSCYQKVN